MGGLRCVTFKVFFQTLKVLGTNKELIQVS